MKLTADDAMALGQVLRQRRETVGMSRAALGVAIHRDPSTIQAYEQGGKKVGGHWIVSSPSEAVLEHIATALRTSLESLLAAAGLESEDAATDAMAQAAVAVSALGGVLVTGEADDIAALLGLALERGLLGRLTFRAVEK